MSRIVRARQFRFFLHVNANRIRAQDSVTQPNVKSFTSERARTPRLQHCNISHFALKTRPSPILSKARLSFASIQQEPFRALGGVRFTTFGSEYRPSQRKRKRKHGFLARLRSRTGKQILVRRRAKGKAHISH